MRKLLMWIVVTIGIAALVRKLRGRGTGDVSTGEVSEFESPVEPPAMPASDDPADDLRRKLSETRTEAAAATGTPLEPEATIDERRAEVHDEGRAAIDEMQRSAED